MANFPISGKAVPEINLRDITIAEWRAMFRGGTSEKEGDDTLAKVAGITVKDVRALKFRDYQALVAAVMIEASSPIDENEPKNSQGEST